MSFHATIVDGQIDFGSPAAAQKFQDWKRANNGARVVIELDKPTRSQSQNAYMWVFFGVIERETGQLATDVHEWAKRKFLPPRFIKVNGEEMKIPGSTKELNKNDFTEYLDKISAEVGIALPDPIAAGYLPH